MRALCVVLVAAPSIALACSVCGGESSEATRDPGPSRSAVLRASVEERVSGHRYGDADAHAILESRTLLRTEWTPHERVTLIAQLPFFALRADDAASAPVDGVSGVGDASLAARVKLLTASASAARTELVLELGGKAPTGLSDHLTAGGGHAFVLSPRAFGGGYYDEHLQPGTGSWDATATAWAARGFGPVRGYAAIAARLNGENARGMHHGNGLSGTIGIGDVSLGVEGLALSSELQLRGVGRDRYPLGVVDENSGGLSLYAGASARYAVSPAFAAAIECLLPVVQWLNGAQQEWPAVSLAVAISL